MNGPTDIIIPTCRPREEAENIVRELLKHNDGPYLIFEGWMNEKTP